MASAADTDVTEDEQVDQGTVVFFKDGAGTDSDMWDDTALVKAYDKAIQQAHQSNSDLKSPKSKKKKNKGKKSADNSSWKWAVGNWCRAVYSEDGQVYDAVIKEMLPEGKCMVEYTDYGNEEEHPIRNLLRPQKPRQKAGSVRSTHSDAACSDCSNKQTPTKFMRSPRSSHTPGAHAEIPSFIPPPPPPLPGMNPCDADEAFHSMLISWYMSGFHTGYYQGLKDGKESS